MNRQILNRTINDIKIPLSDHSDYHQTTGEILEYPGKGVHLIPLHPGLELTIENYHPKKNFVADVEVEPPPIGFAFCLSGKILGSVRGRKDDVIISSGQSGTWFSTCSQSTIEYRAEQPIRYVAIRIEPSLFSSLIQNQFEQIPADFGYIVNGCNQIHYSRIMYMSSSMYMTIHQILNCPYHGKIKQIYLENKALELISHQLAHLLSVDRQVQAPMVLRPDDIERIHEARNILVRNMENPPFLQELAKQVGINGTKLKRGFRQVFGTSVFGYLRSYRMEKARQLLADGKMSVTEVVFAIGYSSPSHFSRAFAKRFGLNPGAYLRETRENATPQIHNMP
jgi:AraC-like DNA-binding protein